MDPLLPSRSASPLNSGGRPRVGPNGTSIRECSCFIMASDDPELCTRTLVDYLTHTAPGVCEAASRLNDLRKALRKAKAPCAVIDAAKVSSVTLAHNAVQRHAMYARAVKGLRIPPSFLSETLSARLSAYDTALAPTAKAVIDVMTALCARPAELMSLEVTPLGVVGYAKSRGDAMEPRPFLSLIGKERAVALLEWVQCAIADDVLPDPGSRGVTLYRALLSLHGIKPSDLRKLGAELAVRANGGLHGTDSHRMALRRLALRHSAAIYPSAAEHYAIVLD